MGNKVRNFYGRPIDQVFTRKRGFLVNLMNPVLHPAHGFVFNELPSAASSARLGCFAPLWLCLLSLSPGLTPRC